MIGREERDVFNLAYVITTIGRRPRDLFDSPSSRQDILTVIVKGVTAYSDSGPG